MSQGVTTTTTTTTTALGLLLCCSGVARLAPSHIINCPWPQSNNQTINYYYNHRPQKWCMDMAPHALEQMSLTVTTPHPFTTHFSLSPSLSKLHPLSVVDTKLSLHLSDICTT
jgi:hypothetical protein